MTFLTRNLPSSVLNVRCGEWDTQREIEPLPSQDRSVSRVIIHPRYHNRTLEFDYALLFVKKEFKLAPNVDVTCLPHDLEDFNTKDCYATGWGKDEFG